MDPLIALSGIVVACAAILGSLFAIHHFTRKRRTEVKAWHFIPENHKLRFSDDREVVVGETLTVEGSPLLCCRGLHASECLEDALRYAPGPVLCRVTVSGDIVYGSDKLSGMSRKCLSMMDIREPVFQWILEVVESAIKDGGFGKNKDIRRLLRLTREWVEKPESRTDASSHRLSVAASGVSIKYGYGNPTDRAAELIRVMAHTYSECGVGAWGDLFGILGNMISSEKNVWYRIPQTTRKQHKRFFELLRQAGVPDV